MSKILIVEDESSFSEALAFLLGKEGFDTVVAEDGRQALEIYGREGADLILLDLMIPGVSGVEVCRTIRTTSQVPIIMLTAKDAEIDKVVGLELGADDYVTKPYSSRELIARIKAVLRRVHGEPDADRPLRAGWVELDPAGRTARVDGAPVDLTRLEFDLLAELAAHPNVVFTRERLLERVWGYQSGVGGKTVDVHVANLRKKLGKDLPIVAVRGVGYRLDDTQ